MSFQKMKKSRPDAAALQAQMNKLKGTNSYQDDRIWYPERDEQGNGYAIIRFLPEPEGEDAPFVKMYNHQFKGEQGWLIEPCPTTIGGECPICQDNNELWNANDGGAGQEIVRKHRKRKMFYYANIYIVKDEKTPENEGKVMLFRFGAKIMDKIELAIDPKFGEDPINPFDFWGGANFKLKIRKVDGNTNYDLSDFADPTQLLKTDKEMEVVYNQLHSLKEFHSEDKFKSEEDLKKRLYLVTGRKDELENNQASGKLQSKDEESGLKETEVEEIPVDMNESKEVASSAEDDEDIAYFENLLGDS